MAELFPCDLLAISWQVCAGQVVRSTNIRRVTFAEMGFSPTIFLVSWRRAIRSPKTSKSATMRRVAHLLLLTFVAPFTALGWLWGADANALQTVNLQRGNLSVLLRDNALSPGLLSGVDSLFNRRDAPDFDAFDPDNRGASAGLNFEHVICGESNVFNAFAPRRGRYELFQSDSHSATLVRREEDDPWALSSTLKYSLSEPNAIDFAFECQAHNKALFGQRRYAVLFFADYMNDVADVAINFRGFSGPNEAEEWIRADAPPGHPD